MLEYDDVRMFSRMGHRVFSTGFYANPESPTAGYVRPPISGVAPVEGAGDLWRTRKLTADNCLQDIEFANLFDVVVIIYRFDLLKFFDGNIRALPVFRTIGQSVPDVEQRLEAVRGKAKIVRYSPNEVHIPSYVRSDALIRFGKYEADFQDYRDAIPSVLSFYQSAIRRPLQSSYGFYEQATRPYPRVLYGNGNPAASFNAPGVEYEEMLRLYAEHSVYFSLGTYPASYTLNLIEAMMTGIPTVALGRQAFANPGIAGSAEMAPVYEVPDILAGAPHPLVADSVEEAQAHLGHLLESRQARAETSTWLRAKARELFSAETVADQWRAFFEKNV